MALRAPTPCRHPGCGVLIDKAGYCPDHKRKRQQQQDAERGTAYERGYTSKWSRESQQWLRMYPLCQCIECDSGRLRVMPANVVDHKKPPRLKDAKESGDAVAIAKAFALFWNRSNWQSMSKTCHDKKTATEDGGFGR